MLQRRFAAGRLAFAVVTFLTLSAGLLVERSRAAPLNVVLILVDDMGWTGLHCYGSDLHETPHIDALASGAVQFTAPMPPPPSVRRRGHRS